MGSSSSYGSFNYCQETKQERRTRELAGKLQVRTDL